MKKIHTPMHRSAFSNILATPVPLDVLYDILCRPRFADSDGEQYVIDKYLKTLEGSTLDKAGNIWVEVPTANGQASETLFSAHTDTVHKAKARNEPYQLALTDNMLHVEGGGVLGADDGTGIWIMLNLIAAKVPGTYIFHRAEETGGIGSQFIRGNSPHVLSKFKRAIAFDRRGTADVITHQAAGRCCSDEFAEELADRLSNPCVETADGIPIELAFWPDCGGTFTDTANYTSIIPECTNLAVGYYDQHTTQECQDLGFCTRLVHQLIAVDWETLPVGRDPSAADRSYHDFWDYDTSRRYNHQAIADGYYTDEDAMVSLILDDPEGVAVLLDHLGYDSYELARFLEASGK